ncbi:hypothetical protein ACHAWO_003306 [Cyclotella atomus]|uniref:DUF4116 domain-containing protein n=1 Tax=Cyclotella atomus TaxID=382360 RepID=A0ABD3N9N4_9STRA
MRISTKHADADDESVNSSSSMLSKFSLTNLTSPTAASKSKKHAILSLKQDGLALSTMNTALQSSRPFVLTAVRQNGLALQYASSKLQDNKTVVKAACMQNGLAVQYASASMRNDVNMALIACRQNGLALQYFNERCANDKDVVLAAVRSNGMALRYASMEMRNDAEVVTAATLRDENAVQFLGSDYTSGKKKLVVSCVHTSTGTMDDNLDSLAEKITRKVMVDASRDWTEERDERKLDVRGDRVLESRTPREKKVGVFDGVKDYIKSSLQKKNNADDAKIRQETTVMKEGQETTVMEEAAAEQIVATQTNDNECKENKFSFFESMGRYIDSTCQTGCEMGEHGCQSVPEPLHCKEEVRRHINNNRQPGHEPRDGDWHCKEVSRQSQDNVSGAVDNIMEARSTENELITSAEKNFNEKAVEDLCVKKIGAYVEESAHVDKVLKAKKNRLP